MSCCGNGSQKKKIISVISSKLLKSDPFAASLGEFTIQVDLWGQLNAVAFASLHTQQLILCDEKERKHHAVPGGFRKLLFWGLEKIRKIFCMQNKSYYS